MNFKEYSLIGLIVVMYIYILIVLKLVYLFIKF